MHVKLASELTRALNFLSPSIEADREKDWNICRTSQDTAYTINGKCAFRGIVDEKRGGGGRGKKGVQRWSELRDFLCYSPASLFTGPTNIMKYLYGKQRLARAKAED